MGHVTPIGNGFAGSATQAGGPILTQADGASASAGAAYQSDTTVSSSVSGSSLSISATMIHSSVTTMLAGIGGGLKDDRMLRMIIAMLILSALLERRRESDCSAELLKGLGQGLGMMLAATQHSRFSETSINIQETVEVQTGSQSLPEGGTPPAGQQLDVTG